MLLQFVDHIAQIQAHIPKAWHIPILSSVVSVNNDPAFLQSDLIMIWHGAWILQFTNKMILIWLKSGQHLSQDFENNYSVLTDPSGQYRQY